MEFVDIATPAELEEMERQDREFNKMQEEALKRVDEEGAFNFWLPEDDYDDVLDYLPAKHFNTTGTDKEVREKFDISDFSLDGTTIDTGDNT